MKIFISSTVYDLVDIRAELAAMMNEQGITPVLSDDKLSAFEVHTDKHSIETCLVNLRACDEVIVVVDQRYGPSLKRSGFEDISATHLEYRTAMAEKKPIRFFVRDRTAGEYSTWRKNHRSPQLEFNWVKEAHDRRLFQMLDEHCPLQADATTSNWYDIFTTSIDLKAAISKYLKPKTLPRRLIDAIARNEFPLFDIDATATSLSETLDDGDKVRLLVSLQNVGGSAAFRVEFSWSHPVEADAADSMRVLTPGQTLKRAISFDAEDLAGLERLIFFSYESPINVMVSDVYRIRLRGEGNHRRVLCSLLERKYYASETTDLLTLSEPETT